jgi:hypothetical protein
VYPLVVALVGDSPRDVPDRLRAVLAERGEKPPKPVAFERSALRHG